MIRPAWASNPDSPIARQRVPRVREVTNSATEAGHLLYLYISHQFLKVNLLLLCESHIFLRHATGNLQGFIFIYGRMHNEPCT